MKTVYIVGKIIPDSQWEFCGVFTEEEKALKACHSELHFIGPVELNKDVDLCSFGSAVDWPGSYFPKYDNMR